MEIAVLLAGVKRDARSGVRHGHLLLVGPAMSSDEHPHSPADSPESWTLFGSPAHIGNTMMDMTCGQTYLQMMQCFPKSIEALATDP